MTRGVGRREVAGGQKKVKSDMTTSRGRGFPVLYIYDVVSIYPVICLYLYKIE
jgi:hypothetical protein